MPTRQEKVRVRTGCAASRSEEHTSELQSHVNLVCRLLLEFYADPPVVHSFPTRRSSDLHGGWVDIPANTSQGMVKLHSWLVQPLGNDKAGVVVLIHPGPGMDNADTPRKGAGANWMRGVEIGRAHV